MHKQFPCTGTLCRGAAFVATLVLSACGGGSREEPPTSLPTPQSLHQAVGPTAPMPRPGEQLTSPSRLARAQADVSNGGYAIDTTDREAVKLFYRTVFASSDPVPEAWTGNVATCDPGDVSAEFRAAVLRRVNWFRAMAGVPASIQLDATYNGKAQQAALMMSANNALNHFPPTTWLCYTSDGADGAGHSDLALGRSGVSAVTDFIRDPGASNTPVGHRRWELYPQAQLMGVGSVSKAAALWVVGSFAPQRPAVRDDFVAWPPKGYTPYQAVYPRWSLSYPNADFSAAVVTMTENGAPIATATEPIANGFGENTIVWRPGAYTDGMTWARPSADTVYQVSVSNVVVGGVARTFSYTTTVFDPDQDFAATQLSGPSSLAAGQQGTYSIAAAAETTNLQWRSVLAAPLAFADGAEAGTANFTVSASPGYDVASTDAAASGTHSFHLAGYPDQVLQVDKPLLFGPTSRLAFASELGFATSSQAAIVEVSLDGGASWKSVFQQLGSNPESTFSGKSISLAAFAGHVGLMRFRYAYLGPGMLYTQTSSGVGWYVDDIALADVSSPTFVGPPAPTASQLVFSTSQPGPVYLQAQAGAYGAWLDWGPVQQVKVSPVGSAPFDCLFDWAERTYGSFLAPAAPGSSVGGAYYYRHYAGTGRYLGVSSADSHVYVLDASGMQDLGLQGQWMNAAGCPPP